MKGTNKLTPNNNLNLSICQYLTIFRQILARYFEKLIFSIQYKHMEKRSKFNIFLLGLNITFYSVLPIIILSIVMFTKTSELNRLVMVYLILFFIGLSLKYTIDTFPKALSPAIFSFLAFTINYVLIFFSSGTDLLWSKIQLHSFTVFIGLMGSFFVYMLYMSYKMLKAGELELEKNKGLAAIQLLVYFSLTLLIPVYSVYLVILEAWNINLQTGQSLLTFVILISTVFLTYITGMRDLD